jgi:hypothetical protein
MDNALKDSVKVKVRREIRRERHQGCGKLVIDNPL